MARFASCLEKMEKTGDCWTIYLLFGSVFLKYTHKLIFIINLIYNIAIIYIALEIEQKEKNVFQ